MSRAQKFFTYFIWISFFVSPLRAEESIQVQGYAEREVKPDMAEWTSRFNVESAHYAKIPELLETAQKLILKFLEDSTVPQSAVQFSPLTVHKVYDKKGGVMATQNFQVRIKDIDKITQLAHGSFKLLEKGVKIDPEGVSYYLTTTSQIQKELFPEAFEDAHAKAETLAKGAGRKLGKTLKIIEESEEKLHPLGRVMASKLSPTDTSGVFKNVSVRITVTFALE